MPDLPPMKTLFRFSPIILILLLHPGSMRADEAVAVSSVVFNGYTRERLPDHSFKPETYVFGEGGCLTRPVYDAGLQMLKFPDIAQIVAPALAQQNYLPAAQGTPASLLILVFWGSTEGSQDHDRTSAYNQYSSASTSLTAAQTAGDTKPGEFNPAAEAASNALDAALQNVSMANQVRDEIDNRNARILGYTDSLGRARFAPHMSFAQDTFAEISSNRYYVVLQAYGLRTAVKEKKLKPLWTTRLSVSERGDFAQALAWMAKNGSRFFGHDSDGLKRQWVPKGWVDLGPLKVIDVSPPSKDEGGKQSQGQQPDPEAAQPK